MNYIKHLTGFFEKVAFDRTLNPTHVSLYLALFQFWNCSRFKNPISINRDEVMRISKISSKATYHKCLKNLHSLGYINYEPSYNPFKGSLVSLFNFADDLKPIPKNEKTSKLKNELGIKQVNEQALNKLYTSSETSTEQALVSYINNTNNTNILNNLKIVNESEQAKKNQSNDNLLKNITPKEKEKSCAKKEKEDNFSNGNGKHFPSLMESDNDQSEKGSEKELSNNFNLTTQEQSTNIKPIIENVKTYFLEQKFPELEAYKFFYHFSSNGWLVGGKSPMVDWMSAAQNWMLNAPKFISNEQQLQPNNLNVSNNKNYAEPL